MHGASRRNASTNSNAPLTNDLFKLDSAGAGISVGGQQVSILIVDHATTKHGRMARSLARSVVQKNQIGFIEPQRNLATAVVERVENDSAIACIAIPQVVGRRLHSGRWATGLRATLNALHHDGIRVFKASPNRDLQDALDGTGWSCRPYGDSRAADIRVGESHFGSSGACVLAAALFAAGRFAELTPTFISCPNKPQGCPHG